MNKKNYLAVLSVTAMSALLVGVMTTTTFAANRDISTKDGSKTYLAADWQTKAASFVELLDAVDTNSQNLLYEYGSKNYDFTKLDAAILGGTTFENAIKDESLIVVKKGLTVVSVSAINATQVKVVFSQEVAGGAGTNANVLARYSLNGQNPSVAVLQADNKTVVLTFTAAQVELTNVAMLVSPIASKADATVLSTQYAGLFTAKDTVAPAIKTIVSTTKVATATSVKVNFSEPISILGSVKIDGVVAIPTFTPNTDTATFSGLSLDAATTHTIQIVGLTDGAPIVNVAGTLSSTFSIVKDATAPVATLSTQGDHTILVTFDKEMVPSTVAAAFPAGATVVKDESLGAMTSTVATVVPDTSNKQYTIDVVGLYTTKTSRTLTIVVPATIADLLGNTTTATTKQVTLTKDVVAPVLTGASFNKNSADGKVTAIVLNVSKGLPAAAVTPSNANMTIVDENGVLVSTTGANSLLGGLGAYTPTAGDTKLVFPVTAAKLTGKYTFTFASGLVSDLAQTANTSAAISFTIDFGAATPSTGTFKIPATSYDVATDTQATATTNTYTVNFATPVKGGSVAGSATDLSKYTINAAALPVGTTITLDATKSIATIVVPTGTIAKTDTAAIFYISGVQNTDGDTVVPVTTTVQVNDNIKPVMNTATLNSNGSVTVGFSEDINASAVGTPADFIVKLNDLSLVGVNKAYVMTDGTGSDAGKYVMSVNTREVGIAAIGGVVTGTNLVTYTGTTTNVMKFVYVDVDGGQTFTAGDIVVSAVDTAVGTPIAEAAGSAYDLKKATTLTITTATAPSTVKDVSNMTNVLKGASTIVIK